MRNIRAVLGDNPLLWCWPQPMRGDGLRFEVADGTGKWIEFHRDRGDQEGEDAGSASQESRNFDQRQDHLAEPPYVTNGSVRPTSSQEHGTEFRTRRAPPSSSDERDDMERYV